MKTRFKELMQLKEFGSGLRRPVHIMKYVILQLKVTENLMM